MYEVLVRFEVRDKVPCQWSYFYSLDNGATWLDSKTYYLWKLAKIAELIQEVPEYLKDETFYRN